MPLGHDLSQSVAYDAMYAGELSFARRRYTRDLRGADIAIVGIPFDLGTANRPGARFGPRAIREQSSVSGMFPWGLWPWGFNVFERHTVIDYSDIVFFPGNAQHMLSTVQEHMGTILEAGLSVLALGGDHTVTYPLLASHAKVHGPLSVIHFDAHSDCWNMGDELNHGTMLFLAVEGGIVEPSRSIQLGIRTPNPDTQGFHVMTVDRLLGNETERTVREIRNVVGDHPVYITFDIDFLDPAYAPGTGTPVVGGPSTHQARQILNGLAGLRVVGADLVEVSPPYDSNGRITALAGATLAHDILYLLSLGRRG